MFPWNVSSLTRSYYTTLGEIDCKKENYFTTDKTVENQPAFHLILFIDKGCFFGG